MEQKFSNQMMHNASVSAVDLMTVRSEVEKILVQMDANDSQDRKIALDAIERLAEKYISPLVEEYENSDESLDPFDLNEIAGSEIRGLVSGILDERLIEQIRGLEPPDDEILREALEYIDVPIDDIGRRNKFYRSWAANKASSTIGVLVGFLKEPLIAPNAVEIDGLAAEKTQIVKLLDKKLSANVSSNLEILLNWINQSMTASKSVV